MVTEMIRKRPKFKEITWLFISLLLTLYVVGAAVPVTYWINVKEITVNDGETAEDVTVNVTREINHPFLGSFIVEIRNQFGWHVCTVPERDFQMRYKKRSITEGISPTGYVSLAYWLGGDDWLDACKMAGLGAGEFRLITCHIVEEPFRILGFPIYPKRERCWEPSNIFTIERDS